MTTYDGVLGGELGESIVGTIAGMSSLVTVYEGVLEDELLQFPVIPQRTQITALAGVRRGPYTGGSKLVVITQGAESAAEYDDFSTTTLKSIWEDVSSGSGSITLDSTRGLARLASGATASSSASIQAESDVFAADAEVVLQIPAWPALYGSTTATVAFEFVDEATTVGGFAWEFTTQFATLRLMAGNTVLFQERFTPTQWFSSIGTLRTLRIRSHGGALWGWIDGRLVGSRSVSGLEGLIRPRIRCSNSSAATQISCRVSRFRRRPVLALGVLEAFNVRALSPLYFEVTTPENLPGERSVAITLYGDDGEDSVNDAFLYVGSPRDQGRPTIRYAPSSRPLRLPEEES